MSIREMREALGTRNLIMQYEEGGKTELYTCDGIQYRVAGGTSIHTVISIIKAGREALGPQSN